MPGAGARAHGPDSGPGATPLQGPGNARITADYWPHPLTAAGRETVPPGATLADLIGDMLPGDIELDATIDGRAVPRAAWHETRLGEGQIVTLRAVAGDGGDDKNPLRILLQLAVIVASIFVPPLLTANLFGQAAIGAAIAIGGGLIINAIAPLPSPDQTRTLPPDPLYSLTGGANRARPYEPLLLVLGTHRVFPDLGAAGYTELEGDDQYLNQIFNFGLGQLEIDELKIGETPLGSFDEVRQEFSDARGRIGLVAGNVDTTADAALDDTEFVIRQTGAETDRIGIDIAGQLFRIDKQGRPQEQAVTLEVQWEPVGGGPGEQRTVELANDSQGGFRQTLNYDLGREDQWTVRVRRTTEPSDEDRTFDDLAWTALRSYQPDEADYAAQTRLGLRIRASGQLSGRLDRLSAIVRQKVPIWDGAAWTAPVPSSNPAYIFRWYAQGIYQQLQGGLSIRLVAGIGLAPGRIDDEALIAWGAWCEAQGLGCDFVLDRAISHAEVLTLIARCGRAGVT